MRRIGFCMLGIALALFLLACAGPTRVEKHFGKSFKQAQLNQILDPEAERNLEPVVGLDGKAAQAGIGKYRKSFEGSQVGAPSFGPGGTQVLDKPIESGYGSGCNK